MLQRCQRQGLLLRGVVPIHVLGVVQIQALILARMAAGVAALAHIVQRAEVAMCRIGGTQHVQPLQHLVQCLELLQPFMCEAEVAPAVFGLFPVEFSCLHLHSTRR
ncbi:hypothetical protein SDC9_179053 [bioreactor metagenome]|uniref:Uncharacterized protein n=1 Tax=bioreactor metagenome TaxID=1076179 RepID=A0A645H0S1_9ZZZZ